MINYLLLLNENLEKLNLNETFSNMNNAIFYILLIVFGIGLIGLLQKEFNLLNFLMYVGCSALAIHLILNPSKLELIGEMTFEVVIGIFKAIPSFDLKNTASEAPNLFIGWWF